MAATSYPPSGDAARAHPETVGNVMSRMPLTRRHVAVGAVLFIAFVVEAWEQVGLVYVSGSIAQDYGVGDAELGMALSAVALGMMIGALAWGGVIDRLGRKRVAVLSLLAYAALALLAAAAPVFWMFVVLRTLSGIAFGGIYAVTFPYFMELLPTRWRGRGAVALSIGFPVGTLLCVFVSQSLGPVSWRAVAVVSALSALWALAIQRWVPESPYWLAARGRDAEAAAVLRDLAGPRGGAQDVPVVFRVEPIEATGRLRGLFTGRVGRLFGTLVLVSFTFSWAYWGLQTWLPVLLQGRGLSLSLSLEFVAISQVVAIPGYVLAAWLTGRYGRKRVFIVFALGSLLGALVFALSQNPAQLYTGNFVLAFFALGAWGIWNTWSGEVLPTAHRGVGYAWITAVVLLGNTLSVPAIGMMMDADWGLTAIVGSVVGFLAVSVIGVLRLPETEGRALA